MALTMVILAMVVVSASAHPVLRNVWLHDATSTVEPTWLKNSAKVSDIHSENAITPILNTPSHAQADLVFGDKIGALFSPVTAEFSTLAQPSRVRLINSAGDLYRVAVPEDEESPKVILNPPTEMFTLAPRGFGTALISVLANLVQMLISATSSYRAAVYNEFSNTPAESTEILDDISCPIGVICSAQPATRVNLGGEAAAKQINAKHPNTLVWDVTPANTFPSLPAPAAKLIQESAPEYVPFSVV